MDSKIKAQAEMLANRLQKRFKHLKKWAKRSGIDIFRLYDRDIPEVPLVLDFYGTENAAISGALYKRPYEKDEAEEEKWLYEMKQSIVSALGIDISQIFIKQRQRQKGTAQYEKLNKTRFEKIVSENGLSFKVNLSDYLDTGLFPDRRLLRAMIREQANGKTVLNLFSYTGSFSVYAASGGAVSTTSVDLSNTYLAWTRENFSLNGFSTNFENLKPRSTQSSTEKMTGYTLNSLRTSASSALKNKNSLIRADVLDFLEKAYTAKNKWDIIILDPPAFSNSKKMTGTFDLKRDLNVIVNYCIRLLNKGGKLFLSVNLKSGFDKSFSLAPRIEGLRITELTDIVTDEDFKGKKVPKTFLFET